MHIITTHPHPYSAQSAPINPGQHFPVWNLHFLISIQREEWNTHTRVHPCIHTQHRISLNHRIGHVLVDSYSTIRPGISESLNIFFQPCSKQPWLVALAIGAVMTFRGYCAEQSWERAIRSNLFSTMSHSIVPKLLSHSLLSSFTLTFFLKD